MDETKFQERILNLQEGYAGDMKRIADGVCEMKEIGKKVQEKYDEQHRLIDELVKGNDVTAESLKAMGVRQDDLTKSIKEELTRRGSWSRPGAEEEKREALEGLGKFLYSLYMKDEEVLAPEREKSQKWVQETGQKGLTTGGAATGAELIPPDYVPTIIRLAEDAAVVRPLCQQVPMRSTTKTFPSLGSVTAAYESEEAASSPQTPATALVTLTAKTARALVPLSEEFQDDADPDSFTALAPIFARRIARLSDAQIIDGTGSPFTGILNVAGTISVLPGTAGVGDAIEDVDWTDLSTVVGSLTTESLINARWVLHRTVMTALRNRTRGSSDAAFVFSAPGQGIPALMWGFPWLLSDDAPPTAGASADLDHEFMFLGNLQNTMFGLRRSFEVAISKDFAFDKMQLHLRVAERHAFVVPAGLVSAFGILQTSSD